MSKKAQRIAELEREVHQLTLDYKAARDIIAIQTENLAKLRAERRPSLRDAAKREFHDKWAWLLDALGVPS